eukprot:553644_1
MAVHHTKKQRIIDNENDTTTQKLTAGWGISDSDSDDDDVTNNNTNNNNNSNNIQTINTNNHNTNNNNNNNNNTNTNNNSSNTNTNGTYSGIAQKLMEKMGYKQGDSLGRNSRNGITEPIEAYNRISSRGGLGYDEKLKSDSNFICKNIKHEYEAEKIEIEIKPYWYTPDDTEDISVPTLSDFESYLKFKKRCNRVGIEWNATFCSIELQREIFSLKSEFDSIGQTKLFMEARNKANPFEGIKREIFQNRAALKMCEIDRILNYLITAPYNGCCITFNKESKRRQEFLLSGWKSGHNDEGISLHDRELWTRELIYFSDLCSGPGGFTEYFLHINKWQCRGWGFTLRGNEDFKLTKFNSNAPWDNFTPEYGTKNNGDICDNDNLIDFRNKVITVSMSGCHIVMSDGGFDCFPNYNSQELLSRQLILCQFLSAMSILRENGIFVCKLFDCFHPFTASIIYIASLCFNKIGLIKPNQSRPANSERYIICIGYKYGKYNKWNKQTQNVSTPHYIISHLLDINMIINKFNKQSQEEKTNTEQDVLKEVCALIPINKTNKSFIKWLKNFNEINGKRQCRHLKRIKKYLQDKTLKIDDQITIRKRALKYWFNTPTGDKFIVLDPQFGCRYVTKYEDYIDISLNGTHTLSTLITNKELLKRIKFEYNNSISYIYDNSLEDFKKYNIRGDWFSIAFEFKINKHKYEPKWVTLISTGNRNIYECIREKNNFGDLICINKTNDLMRLPADTVIDCIKIHNMSTNCEIYHIFDCWCIGSKSLYKRNFIQRQEFCRVLYQGYGSKYIKFAGARPALQSIKREYIIKNKKNIYVWFIRNKKTKEQNVNNKNNKQLSQYWRPISIKLWNGQKKGLILFEKLLSNLKYINHQQMQKKKKQTK